MPEEPWDGIKNRRDHDYVCDRKWKTRKKELKEWVCLSSKPTRLKQGIMWAAMGFAVSLSMSIAMYSYVNAGEQSKIDTLQSSDIEHNQEMLDSLNEKYELHLREQRIVNREIINKLNQINVKVGQIETLVE